jgi:hypothetical protein
VGCKGAKHTQQCRRYGQCLCFYCTTSMHAYATATHKLPLPLPRTISSCTSHRTLVLWHTCRQSQQQLCTCVAVGSTVLKLTQVQHHVDST